MSAFQSLISRVTRSDSDDLFSAEVEPSWLQGRTAFGGLSSALVYEAMRQTMPDDRRLRALAVSFVGPVTAGQHQVQLRQLRAGGSVTHLHGELITEGEITLSALAAFGKSRTTSVQVEGPVMPEVPLPDECKPLPFIEDVTPAFTQHYDMRFAHGAPPLAGAEQADFGMWLRFREPTKIDIGALISLGDVPPMPGLNMIKPPGVGSSLTWYLELPAILPAIGEHEWLYYDYRCQAAGDGYYNNLATIWTADGECVMLGRQVAMVFEK